MSGVAHSSSMHSSSLPTTQAEFNVANETNVLRLLRLIHRSPLSIESKNELRDAIFAYRIDKVTSDFAALQTLFAGHDIHLTEATESPSPDHPAAEEVTKPTPDTSDTSGPIGFRRHTPHFTPPTPARTPAVTKTTPTPRPEADQATAPTMQPAKPPTTDAVTQEVPSPKAVKETTADTGAHKIPIKVSRPAATAPVKATADTTPSDAVTPANPPETKTTASDPEARIKQIKHEINTQVGNPISLIDMDDAVGREYMAALLDAMKQVSIEASSAASERAMSRLENAFAAAQALLAKTPHTNAVDDAQPAPAPSATAAAETASTPASSAPIRATAAPQSPAPAEEPAPAPAPTAAPEVPTMPAASTPPPAPQAVAQPEPPQAASVANIPKATAADTTNSTSISSPASEKTLSTLMEEKQDAAKSAQPAPSGDPLMSEEVSKGLAQLLSEWSIFKRSGMFGTGPNGIEHPLYETLSQLTMSSVLTGRFEGVTPEVKRSINDYMNGWRYEEGIVHEAGETFEHYLRRVVLHILDKRKKIVDEQK